MALYSNFSKVAPKVAPWTSGDYWPPIDSMYDFSSFVRLGASTPSTPGLPFATGSSTNNNPIVVIGAGIAGLVATYEIARSAPDKKIILLTDADAGQVGGKIRTEMWPNINDVLIKLGAMRFPQTPLFTYYTKLAGMVKMALFPNPGETTYTKLVYRGVSLQWLKDHQPPGLFSELGNK